MGCGMTVIKYLMFFFNLLIFLSGGALLGIGIWVLVDGDTFKRVISSDPLIFNSVYIIIAVGAALFLIGFLGCCGAIKENRCLLGTFFAIVLILFLLQIVGAVLAIVLREQAYKVAKEEMKNENMDKDTRKAWDSIQGEGECCGLDGKDDWSSLPDSCCKTKPCTAANAYKTGCKEKVTQMFWILAGISLGILLVEILAMIFSCLLFREVGKSSY